MATELQTVDGVVRIPTGTWRVDPDHSSVEFQIKHLMIATVRGRFKDFDGTMIAADDITESAAFGVVKAASIDTSQPERDAHLRSAEFFDAERYEDIRFASTRLVPLGGPKFRVVGELTIKDATHEIELETTIEGAERDPWGNDRVGLSARGWINRKHFGLTWQMPLETGGLVLGDQVKIIADVSAVRE